MQKLLPLILLLVVQAANGQSIEQLLAEAKESNNVETLLAQTVVQDVSKVPLFIVESPEPQKIQPVKGKQNFPCLKLMSAEKVENNRRAMRWGLTCDKGQCQERINKNGKEIEICPFLRFSYQ